MENEEQLKFAYHGLSLTELSRVIYTGQITAENGTIYCEGSHRRHCTLPDAVHDLSPDGPSRDPFLYASVLELVVHRSKGIEEGPVYMQPLGTVFIIGVYFHVIPLVRSFETGYRGWFQICDTVFEKIGCHRCRGFRQ